MVAKVFRDDPLFFQRLMACAGLYKGDLDGDWGPLSQGAADAFDALFKSTAKTYGTFDARSEGNIATMLPVAQRAARQFLAVSKQFKYTVSILSGTRTYHEQDALFYSGRGVTKARGGQSNHNFGIAFDVGIFDGKKYFEGRTKAEDQAYIDLRKLNLKFGPRLDWGGDWKSIVDRPHYELHTGKTTSQVRALLETGKPYV